MPRSTSVTTGSICASAARSTGGSRPFYGDSRRYLESARFNKPGTIPLRFQTEVRDGCPSDCGLCPEHKQRACLGIIEVNTG
jgi:uncharacterized radical SAM superfamily Fe-S cluster-containing enzyme